MKHQRLLCLLLWAAWIAAPGHGFAAVRVDVITGPQAPSLEQMAGRELVDQWAKLFEDVQIEPGDSAPASARKVVLLGSPQTNPAVAAVCGDSWPGLSKQGFVIKSFRRRGQQGIVIGGGSPVATLWAVYEFGHRLGIRYLLRGDIFPAQKVPLKLDGFDVKSEPVLRTRTWRTINDFAIGPESWGAAEHERFLRQLAKLKFNRLMLAIWPWQPFVTYEFQGVTKQTATHWFGERFPVDGETAGKKVFSGQRFFENPDFAGITDPQALTQAGIRHARRLIQTAQALGMEVGISISPLELPKEFQKVLPKARVSHSVNDLTIQPGRHGPDDSKLQQLVTAKIRAYLDTYPTVDVLYLTLPEFPDWTEHAGVAWKALHQQSGRTLPALESLIESARNRPVLASGERGARALQGNLVALFFLNRLLEDKELLRRKDGRHVDLVITHPDPALFPVLDRVLPAGAEALHFVDYTARRVAENRNLLDQVPTDRVRSQLILTLADDNVGILPQSSLNRLGSLMDVLRHNGWDGFSTRYWIPGELDPVVYFLARASWDPELTPRQAHDDLWVTMTGSPAATERLWLAWKHLEDATELIDANNIGFAFPVSGMMMKHYRDQPVPKWWKEATELYTQRMIELYRALGAVDPRAQDLVFYYAKRGEYVLEYLGAVQAVREAALAKAAGESDMAVEHLETALESTYNCISTLADVARDQSDRGLVAVLNAYAYRPLLAELERAAQ